MIEQPSMIIYALLPFSQIKGSIVGHESTKFETILAFTWKWLVQIWNHLKQCSRQLCSRLVRGKNVPNDLDRLLIEACEKKAWHTWFVIHYSIFIRHYYMSLHPCDFSERFHHFWMVFLIVIVKAYTCRQILMVLVPWTLPPSLPSPLEARTSGVETCPRNVVSVNQRVLFLTLSSIFFCLMEFRGVCFLGQSGSNFLVWGQDLVFNVHLGVARSPWRWCFTRGASCNRPGH